MPRYKSSTPAEALALQVARKPRTLKAVATPKRELAKTFRDALREPLLARWGGTAEHQTAELLVLQGRLSELADTLLTEVLGGPAAGGRAGDIAGRDRAGDRVGDSLSPSRARLRAPTPAQSAVAKLIATLQPSLSAMVQSLRLLIGSATERKEVLSLSQLVVSLRAEGYGQGVRGPGRGGEGNPDPPPSPSASRGRLSSVKPQGTR